MLSSKIFPSITNSTAAGFSFFGTGALTGSKGNIDKSLNC